MDWHRLLFEFLGTGLMILFGCGVHSDVVLVKTKYRGSGHLFAITTWAFGISVVLWIFGGVCINPAMALAQSILGMLPWSMFVPVVIAEMLGAFVGALFVWLMYKDHFEASAKLVDPVDVRNIFSTNPIIRNLPRNYFVEVLATTVFLTAILALALNKDINGAFQLPLGVGFLVWAIGMGFGGTTGFAMNQARDLGPRLAYQLLPIKNKTTNDWRYGLIVPGTAPFVGAVFAALAARYVLHLG